MKTGKRLLLIPTDFERNKLPASIVDRWLSEGHRMELCGFGQIVAAARTMKLLSFESFAEVYLLGIAGSLHAQAPVGTAFKFGSVCCDGLGVGQGREHVSSATLGWQQWPNSPVIEDKIEFMPPGDELPMLVSVMAASATPLEAACRRDRFPEGIAEDMEGFGVAVACRFASVPLTIIRGISNVAGDRNHADWDIAGSLEIAMQLLERDVWGDSTENA